MLCETKAETVSHCCFCTSRCTGRQEEHRHSVKKVSVAYAHVRTDAQLLHRLTLQGESLLAWWSGYVLHVSVIAAQVDLARRRPSGKVE